MLTLPELIPEVDILLALQPEELGGAILEVFNSDPTLRCAPYDFIYFMFQPPAPQYPIDRKKQVEMAILEAWAWLGRETLLVEEHNPTGPREFFITRRGRELGTREAVAVYRQASLLPKDLLHSHIAEKCWVPFIRGDHDTAVFQAFKEVEVEVRAAGGYEDSDIGVQLMRKAFHAKNGPLTDMNAVQGERQALQDLFAGAIGSYKNPHSHRTVTISDPADAVEMIMLASHLLRIVDARGARE